MIKNSNHKNTIIRNTFALLILQGSLYIVPLIILPYLIRVLGIETFGLLAFATATIAFFRGIVEYGFNLSGTKQITDHRNNIEKISELFSGILISKLLLSFICFFILSLLVVSFDVFSKNWEVFLLTFLIVFGDVIFPLWFFQGVENMKMITYLQIAYKTIFVFLVFLFVQHQDDFLLVPLLDSIGSIIIGFFAVFYVKRKYQLKFYFVSKKLIIDLLKDGMHIFFSRITVILYTSLNTFVLGLITNNSIVGIYAIAEKIYMAIRGLLNPFVQAIFPYLVQKYKENRDEYYKIVQKINYGYFTVLVAFSLLTYVFSDNLFYLISGHTSHDGQAVLKIFAIALLFAIGTLYSNLLVIKNESHLLSKITFVGMMINIVFIIPVIYMFGIFGVALLFLSVQLIQAILQMIYNKEILFPSTIKAIQR